MSSKTKVKPRIRRAPGGDWLAYVLIGEREHCQGEFPDKRTARRAARVKCREFRAAFGED